MPQPKAASPSVVVITGASSGIGYELAKLFAHDGYHLVLIARRSEPLLNAAHVLQHLPGATVTTLVADLSRREAPEDIITELKRRHLRVHVLVNNAGVGLYGPFVSTDLATELAMIQIHVATLTHLTKRLLPDLVETQGKILNVASASAFQPTPLTAVYSATKAYVLSFSEALANELHGSGVSVTTLCPGPTVTGFQQRAGMGLARLTRANLLSAEAVARSGYRGLMRNKTLVIPGWRNWLAVSVARWLPRRVVAQLARKIQDSRAPADLSG